MLRRHGLTGAPYPLPAWARPGSGAPKPPAGPPRKRQRTSALPQGPLALAAALPPPLVHGLSRNGPARKLPKKVGQVAKRPYNRRHPASGGNLQPGHPAARRGLSIDDLVRFLTRLFSSLGI